MSAGPAWGWRAAEALMRAGVALHGGLYESGLLNARPAPVPVVSVGNLAVGGTGKTPCVIWLVKELLERGERPVVLSRGYRRKGQADLVLGSETAADPRQAGDEPVEILEATGVPVIVGRDRRVTARRAARDRAATCLVLDDGFQHRPLARDFDLVLLDARAPFGNGRLLPAGPLRESPAALSRADAVLLTRADRAPDPEAARQLVRAHLKPAAWTGWAEHRVTGLRPLAAAPAGPLPPAAGAAGPGPPAAGTAGPGLVAAGPTGPRPSAASAVLLTAGIADPEAVKEGAAAAGLKVAGLVPFPDHHAYSPGDLSLVLEAAGGLPIVTTAKDAVRWRDVPGLDPGRWWVLEIAFHVREPQPLIERVAAAFRLRRAALSRG